jgi:hypothetical protein
VGLALSQGVHEPYRNPECRGIRLLNNEGIRALPTHHKKPRTFPLDERKSIFITDQAILILFTFDAQSTNSSQHCLMASLDLERTVG